MTGNKEKAKRVLQKAKEQGARPAAILCIAYKNLLLNQTELLTEEQKQQLWNFSGEYQRW